MNRTARSRVLLPALGLALATGGCSGDGGANDTTDARAAGATAESSSASAGSPAAPVLFTEADLDAYARGLAKEIELVRAAQERQRTAATPEERGRAIQAQWEDQTIPEGARSAGLPPDRYRQIREIVGRTLQTLDFQGKIDGPLEMDSLRASPEMRRRLASDPFAELPPTSAAALRARMDRVLPVWVQYVRLTAVAG